MRKLPPLNALRAFEAAARHVSFTKAAKELHVTHGAISRQVSLLEDWLDARLFQRGASQIGLTDSGRAYAQEVTSLLDRLSVVTAHVIEKAAPSAVTVSAPPTFTMRWLIPRLSVYHRKRPGVEVKLTTSIAPVLWDMPYWVVNVCAGPPAHSKGINVLYADGHAKWVIYGVNHSTYDITQADYWYLHSADGFY